jgi:hypothetical protein
LLHVIDYKELVGVGIDAIAGASVSAVRGFQWLSELSVCKDFRRTPKKRESWAA